MPKLIFRSARPTFALAFSLFSTCLHAANPSFSSSNFAVGTTRVYLAVGDFNGDGRQDIAVANQGSANITILLAKAGGGYASSTVTVAGGITSIVATNLNGDGKIVWSLAIPPPPATSPISPTTGLAILRRHR
jgi:hypothetical protein